MIFDANVSYGPVYTPTLAPCRTPRELVAALDWNGVDRALVAPDFLRNGSPGEMNPRTAEEMAPYRGRLEPVWAIIPPDTDELGTVPELLAAMKRHEVRALAAYPSRHRYILDRRACGALFDAMVARRIPLILPLEENSAGRTGWDLVGTVLDQTPELRLIAVGSGPWGDDRLFRPLFRTFAGLHLETSRYELDGGVAAFTGKFGADRLIWGSGYPRWASGGALLTAMHADIPLADREKIVGDNLRRILDEVEL